MSGTRAPSCWMEYRDSTKGDIILQDVLVPAAGDTTCSYYCTLQWNAGQNGGGYCGIQNHPSGKIYIFSIWDPKGTHLPITAVYRSPGTKTASFGGEGTGLKSTNLSLGWNHDHWYSLVAKRWDHNTHTYFGFWVHDQSGQKWTHLVTMDFPVTSIYFNTKTGCFVEDWVGTGQHERMVQYRDGFKRKLDRSWFPFSNADFRVVQEAGSQQYNHNYNAGVKSDYYFMQSGGSVTPAPGLGTNHAFHNSSTPSHPEKPPIDFSITSATAYQVTWQVPESSTPQFSYSLNVDGSPYPFASDTNPETRSISYNLPRASEIEVTLEDILGRQVMKKMTIH